VAHTRKLWIEGPAGRLEAALRLSCPARATAVVAHPHPLHGGTLDNPVIFHTDRELNRAGLTTLRFNFRGVGDSEGTHDDGRGETDDLAHASAWLQALMPEAPHLLVGYSFGAICSVRHAARSQNVRAVIAIGLPVRLYPLEEIDQLPCPLAIVQGTDDEFGTPEEIRARTPGSPIQTIDKATHLFPGTAAAAATAVVRLTQSFL